MRDLSQDLTHVRPTPANYNTYVNQRKFRTEKAISESTRISGAEIKEKNLSVRMIYDAGYRYDPVADMMIKD